MTENQVSIVIPNYNGEKILPRLLTSINSARDNRDNNILETIVVDDCSKDGSVEIIKNNFPWVRLIKHKKNRGFSSSVNTGVRSSKGNLVALLNTDIVVEGDFLKSVFKHFNENKTFAVSFNEKKYGPSRGIFENGFIVHRGLSPSKEAVSTFWVSGGSGVFRRDLFIKLGGMDEKLFSPFYWEDVDLSYRALKRGYKLLWDPLCIVEHEHEATISKIALGKRRRIEQRNHLFFIWKNLTSKNMIRKHFLSLIKRCVQHPGFIVITFLALSKIRVLIKARKKELKESKISDEMLLTRSQ